MGETRACAAYESQLQREGKGPGDGIPAWLSKTWGTQPTTPGVSSVGRTWARREPRMGLQEERAERTVFPGIARKVVIAIPLPPQV